MGVLDGLEFQDPKNIRNSLIKDINKELTDFIYETNSFKMIEESIGYQFDNKMLLVTAFTHTSFASSYQNGLESYEKFEFIGDYLLDFMVVNHFCSRFKRNINPGNITRYRKALVKNRFLAQIIYSHGLYKYLLNCSPEILRSVSNFEQAIGKMDPFTLKLFSFPYLTLVDRDDSIQHHAVKAKYINIPKFFADLLESLVCAVYLDSSDISECWKLFCNLVDLETFDSSWSPNLKSDLNESSDSAVGADFSEVYVGDDNLFCMDATVEGLGEFSLCSEDYYKMKNRLVYLIDQWKKNSKA
ncbi:MAG: Dicer dimerization domain [Paramarteilia canceri]